MAQIPSQRRAQVEHFFAAKPARAQAAAAA